MKSKWMVRVADSPDGYFYQVYRLLDAEKEDTVTNREAAPSGIFYTYGEAADRAADLNSLPDRVSDIDAIKAAQIIKAYCHDMDENCRGCIFHTKHGCPFADGRMPLVWR